MSEPRVDPWGDMPLWSDGEAAIAGEAAVAGGEAAAGGASRSGEPAGSADSGAKTDADQTGPRANPTASDAANDEASAATPAGDTPATCPWCATPASAGATRCSSCGAALAQRETIGDLVIPGLTAVAPALKDFDGRPLHLRGPSPSQGVASGIIVAAAAGGPVGLAILGGVGAVAAAEFLGAGGEKGKGHEHVGETSEAVLQAIERLERGEHLPTANDPTLRPELGDAKPSPAEEESVDGS